MRPIGASISVHVLLVVDPPQSPHHDCLDHAHEHEHEPKSILLAYFEPLDIKHRGFFLESLVIVAGVHFGNDG